MKEKKLLKKINYFSSILGKTLFHRLKQKVVNKSETQRLKAKNFIISAVKLIKNFQKEDENVNEKKEFNKA